MLHSLNVLRVLAEFCIVHQHIMVNHYDRMHFTYPSVDLMCFFFVLSGFVMMHTHRHDDFSTWKSIRAFWWHRTRKLYPIYIVLVALDLIVQLSDSVYFPPDRMTCAILQVFMLNAWADCRLQILNPVSWYVAVLFWLWLVFPLVQPWVLWGGKTWPWAKAAALNIMGVCLVSVLLEYLPLLLITNLPFVRVIEFLMGCVAAVHVETLPSVQWRVAAAMCLLAVYTSLFYIAKGGDGPGCEFKWVPSSGHCLWAWATEHINCNAFLWMTVIHGLASSELNDVPARAFMHLEQNELLRTMSTFSLQLYLGHAVLDKLVIIRVSSWIGVIQEWEMDTIMVAVYLICYGIKIYVQPWLD